MRVLGKGWGEAGKAKATAHVLLETVGGGSAKGQTKLQQALSTSRTCSTSSRGTSHRVQHEQICVLHKQVLSRRQLSNLLTVLTFVSFNSVIPKEIITNMHKYLCPAWLITTLFITAQSPK